MGVRRVFVIGAGLMGSGIAQVCAQAGLSVSMRDLSQEVLDQAIKKIGWSVGKLVEKGKVQGTVDSVLARIETTTRLDPASGTDLIIEAVFGKPVFHICGTAGADRKTQRDRQYGNGQKASAHLISPSVRLHCRLF